MSRPKMLWIDHLLPWPAIGGSQIKTYHTLQMLADCWDIRFIALIRNPEEAQNIPQIAPYCRLGADTVLLPRTKVSNIVTAATTLVTGESFIVRRDAAPEIARRVKEELSNVDYRLLWVGHLQMAQFIPAETGKVSVVLDEHNIEFRIPQRIADTPGKPLARWYAKSEWPRLRNYERQAILRADLTLAVSEEDAIGLRTLVPEKMNDIIGVPIGVDTDYFAVTQRKLEANTLLSIGTMYWPPNVDAMLYFCEEIYPKIKATIPGIRLDIVGAKPVPEIVALGSADTSVRVTGSVPDVRPYAEDCGVFIVPLRSGSGMRVKILTALSMGLPVVSTSVGAEGIEVTHGKDILLADTSESFADAVLSLLANPTRAAAIGAAGRRLIEERYSWQVIGEQLRTVLSQRFADPETIQEVVAAR